MKTIKSGKTIIINYRYVRIISVFLIGLIFIVSTFILTKEPNDSENFYFYALITIITLCIIIGYLILPHYCVIDSKGIKIVYAFGVGEYAQWKQIKKIRVDDDVMYRGSFITRYNYIFEGLAPKRKYMTNEFMKCKKLEKALSIYAKDKLNNNLPK